MLIRLCPEVPLRHPVAYSPSPTLPTSNDHDRDLMSYGRCRWEWHEEDEEGKRTQTMREKARQRVRDGESGKMGHSSRRCP